MHNTMTHHTMPIRYVANMACNAATSENGRKRYSLRMKEAETRYKSWAMYHCGL